MKKIKRFKKSGSEKELWQILAEIKDPKEIQKFMNDLLSPSEVSMITQRWVISKLFNKGWTYDKIVLKIGAGKGTINRIYNILHRGKGGFTIGLNVLRELKEIEEVKKKEYTKSNLERYIDRRIKKGK